MREIKFRWWDKTKNAMCYGVEQYIEGCLIDYEPLMQYTGLKDKNGREIYEGDVVYLAGYGDYEVEWPFIQLYQSSWEDDIGSILGNIYENPELLAKD